MKEACAVLGERLVSVRRAKGMSQKEAAEALSVSQALLSHYEKGIRECGLAFLRRAADCYCVSVDYLLGLTDDTDGVVSDNPDEQRINARNAVNDKHVSGSVMPVLGRKLIFNGVNVLYWMLSEAGSDALTSAVTDDILLAVYNAFRTAYLSNPDNSEDFFGVTSDYYPRLIKAREASLLAIANSPKGSADGITEKRLTEEFGAVLSSVNNIIGNCESAIRQQKTK